MNYFRVYSYKYHFFILFKSFFKDSREKKFIDRNRIDVFIRCNNGINSQYRLKVPNIKLVIKTYTIKFTKDVKVSNMNLNIST